MFQVFSMVLQMAQNRHLHKTDRHIWSTDVFSACFFFFFYRYQSIFIMGSLYPQPKHAYSALRWQALTECSPPNFWILSITASYGLKQHGAVRLNPMCTFQVLMVWNLSPAPSPCVCVYVCVTAHQQTTVKPNNNWTHIIIFIWTVYSFHSQL